MDSAEAVEEEILVRGHRCRVMARKVSGKWNATGTFLGHKVEIRRAATPEQAFEWWKNKAGMQQPEK